ncbi:MAG TPA: hydroxymethylbilane synthase [Candidatus Polarisedimenticolaceae bacterium]|nr:hydroxymethylbilane synthase [Candidatus Polarisedimenticolaceae bacterium]
MSARLRIGTRGSALALWQARDAEARLSAAHPGVSVEIVVLRTEGDRFSDARLAASGGRGVFVKEIQEALLAGTVDLGVHSLKDLPTEPAAGTAIAAILDRADPRDALVSRGGGALASLRPGALLGTGSPRRRGQIAAARPDVVFAELRGNVDTRVRKVVAGELDGVVLAVAGLTRLGIDEALWSPIPTEVCLPAPGQGAVAIETRAEDGPTRALVAALDHEATATAAIAERAFLAALGAGCLAPAGAHARFEGDRLVLDAVVAMADGSRAIRESAAGSPRDPVALGWAVAEEILAAGGDAIVRASR